MAKVWKMSQHSGTDLLMLLAIADFADDNGNAHPAVTTLASKCRMTPRNANLILANLKKSGELSIRLNEGPKGTNRYLIQLPPPEALFTPEAHFTLKATSPTPEAGFPKPLKPASDEPSVNHKEPSTVRIAQKTRSAMRTSGDVSSEFAAFWNSYPRKVDKVRASKAWAKLNPGPQVVVALMAGLERAKQSEQWNRDGGKYVPHPKTWLNGRRWEDEGQTSGSVDSSPLFDDGLALLS